MLKFKDEINVYFLFLSDEGPMLETFDHTIRIGSTSTFLKFKVFSFIFFGFKYSHFTMTLFYSW